MTTGNREKSVYCRFTEQEWSDIGKIARAEGTSRSAIIRKAVNVLLSGGADKWAEAQAKALGDRAEMTSLEEREAEALGALMALEQDDPATFEALLGLARDAAQSQDGAALVRAFAQRIAAPNEPDRDPGRAGTGPPSRGRKKGANAASGRG